MLDKASLRDIVGVRILESVVRVTPDDHTATVIVTVNGVASVFKEDNDGDGYECQGPRKPTAADTGNHVKQHKSTTFGKIVTLATRCTHALCGRGLKCTEHADVLFAVDKKSNKVVFEIGTEVDDDYDENTFVFEVHPRGVTPDWMKP